MTIRIAIADDSFAAWADLLALLHSAFEYQRERINPPSSLYKLDEEAIAAKAREDLTIDTQVCQLDEKHTPEYLQLLRNHPAISELMPSNKKGSVSVEDLLGEFGESDHIFNLPLHQQQWTL